MRKFFFAFMIFNFLLLFSGCSGDEQKEVKVLTLAETYPDEHITTKADIEFAKLVEEKSGGLIKIDVRSNGELGTESEALESVFNGKVDFARVSMSAAGSISDIPAKMELPYLFRDSGHMWRSVEKVLGPALDLDLLGKDGKLIAYFDAGAKNIYTKNAVLSLENLKGLKIANYGVSDFVSDFFIQTGIKPIDVEYNNVLEALEKGTADGAEGSIVDCYNMGHYKYAPNIIKAEFRRMPDMLVMKDSFYNELSPAEQDVIISAANEASIHQREKWADYENEITQKLTSEGCVIADIPLEIKELFQEEADYIYKEVPRENVEVTLIEQVKSTK